MPSLLDGELEVSESSWIVSLLRKPGGMNAEHAFILVEGSREAGRILFRRYELVLGDNGVRTYEVLVNEWDVAEALAKKTLVNDILNKEETLGKNWQISSDKAEELHQLVEESRVHPERVYNVLGNISSAPNSAPNSEEKTIDALSPNPTSGLIAHGIFAPSGHNCFTWSRAMLYQLNVESITNSLPRRGEELMASITSRLLADNVLSSPASLKSGASGNPAPSSKSTCFIM